MSLTAPIHKARVWVSSLLHSKNLPRSAELRVPYFSQFMSADLVKDYIEHKKALNTDPQWQQSGASDPDEYERWTWSDCGIACFKMILVAMDKEAPSIPLVKLAKEAMMYGAFKVEGEKISPLHYAEFCTFVREKYGLKAYAVPALSVSQIKKEVAKGNFVIVSVHPSIRHPDVVPPKRGGHLVLVVGYDDERCGFYLHNPSGYQSVGSQERAFVAYNDFKRFFAYRGIVIESKASNKSVSFELAKQYLGRNVEVVMDRPLGSKHPKHGFVYEANYGFIQGVKAPDGEDLDAYYLGVQEPLERAHGTCIAIAHRNDNDDDKLIVVPVGRVMKDEEIASAIRFQEQWFDTVIVR